MPHKSALVRLRSLIPTHMNDEIWAYLGLSAESMCGHSTITVPNPTPFPLQGPPVLEDEWTNAWTMDIPAPIHYPQAPPTGVHSSSLSTIRAIDEAAGRLRPESLITSTHDEDLPVTRRSDSESMSQTTFIPSILRGSEGSLLTSITSNQGPRDNIFRGGDTNYNWHQEGVSTNALDYGNRYTHTHTTSDFSVPSTLQSVSRASTIVPYQEQRASRGQLEQLYKTRKVPVAASSRSSRRPGGNRGALQGKYVCSTCGRRYAQQSGVTRHHRDVHEVSFCMHCRNFKWHRHHQLKEHLARQHPDVDLLVALGEATRSRRKATMTSNRIRRHRAHLHATEHARWGSIESRPGRSMPPPARAKITSVSNLEDARKLELQNAVYAHTAFPSIKEHAPLATDLGMSARGVEICSQNKRQSAAGPRGCTTAPPIRPRACTSLCASTSGYHGGQTLGLGPAPVGDLETCHTRQRSGTGISSR
ncbi:hypothetical protein DFH94DRAFT_768308 [Russula ochroleuca]|uniref:C2H2-type domain-containing protein n=1 Tax=Russula ochroleuca TaxID=152965 RepID=A0A9P5JZ33_9AGAM|nr:hypothetical protein DFH94DRAFT_768308 [Russula ochroleuca]